MAFVAVVSALVAVQAKPGPAVAAVAFRAHALVAAPGIQADRVSEADVHLALVNVQAAFRLVEVVAVLAAAFVGADGVLAD